MSLVRKPDASEVSPRKVKKFLGYGIGAIVVLGLLTGGPTVEVDHGVAKVSTVLTTGPLMDIDLATYNTHRDTYKVVQSHPELQGIEQTIYVNKYGLTDKYGNDLKEHIKMGTLTWTKNEVEDIRKFQSETAFTQNALFKEVTAATIANMQGADLLR